MRKKSYMSLIAMLTATSMMSATVFAAGPAGDSGNVTAVSRAQAGWQKDSNGWWYLDEYGEYPKDCVRYIHGDKYLFDEYGYMKTGWYYKDTGDYGSGWYYFKDSGKMAVDETFDIKGYTYLFNTTGKMVRDMVFNRYYYDTSGARNTTPGWKQGEHYWYYVNDDGYADNAEWKEIDGKKYYFYSNEHYLITDTVLSGYYINKSGQVDTTPGWKIYNDNWWCYVDENGNLVNGWQEINGKTYYFDYYILRIGEADGYYLDHNGALDTTPGWKYLYGHDVWYYVGEDGMLVNGWEKINGVDYYFYPRMAYDEMVEGDYYVNDSGAWDYTKGWKLITKEDVEGVDKWIYVDDNGKYYKDGWKWINGKCYFFEDGVIATGRVIDDSYVNGSGAWDSTLGWKHILKDGYDAWFYVDKNGKALKEGWKWINGKCYFFNDYSEMMESTVIDGSYVGSDGAWDAVPGWKYMPYIFWSYVDDNGRVPLDKWLNIDGKYYHFNINGYLSTSAFIDGYYVDENGVWRQ